MLKILIWGTGQGAVKYLEKHLEMLDYIDIAAFVDGRKSDDRIEYFAIPGGTQKEKISPAKISGYSYDYIVVLSTYYEEIRNDAVNCGVDHHQIMRGTEFYLYWIKKGYLDFKKKYGAWLKKREYENVEEQSNYVWVSWLQGYDEAPIVIQKCIDSIKKYSKGQNFCFITMQNYQEYVEIPDYLLRKLENGMITFTFFSDILRLLLLDRYGGLWVDATVFCMGDFKGLYHNSDFFTFRITDKNDGRVAASWFIYSVKGHLFIKETLSLLLRYCMESEKMEHYYIIHYFFRMVTECYREVWEQYNTVEVADCYWLGKKINELYSIEKWKDIADKMPVQKLNRRNKINTEKENTFYSYITSGNEM